MYTKFSNLNNRKMRHPVNKQTKDSNSYFTKDDT